VQNKIEILIPETNYHVYNRANGSERLFHSNENYRFFLQKYQEYIEPIADTFCYCLMPNHFHFLVRIKSEATLQPLTGFETLSGVAVAGFLSKQFSNLFNSYTQAFNKQHGRKGALFMRPFKRITVNDELYRLKLVHYIHYNPLESNLCSHLAEWPHSSYRTILLGEKTFLESDELIEWFGDKENFIQVHQHIFEANIIKI
jgi:REP element-mobilizing transposase RayT